MNLISNSLKKFEFNFESIIERWACRQKARCTLVEINFHKGSENILNAIKAEL